MPLEPLKKVEDLFLPEAAEGAFSLWFGLTSTAGGAPRFKVYLNPQIRGKDGAADLVSEAMERLGFARAWTSVTKSSTPYDPRRDELIIVCLDLSMNNDARVKVYRRHHHATAKYIDAVASVALDYQAGDAIRFYDIVAGTNGPFESKGAATSLTFRHGDVGGPSSATLAFPIAEYSDNDQVARKRITRYITNYGLSAASYERAIDAFAVRPLDRGQGIHAHVTLRREAKAPRVTMYFASEAYTFAT